MKDRAKYQEAALRELGYKDGDLIPAEKRGEVEAKVLGVISQLLGEEVELNTKLLSADELYVSLLSIEENSSLTIEQKATLLQYLMK